MTLEEYAKIKSYKELPNWEELYEYAKSGYDFFGLGIYYYVQEYLTLVALSEWKNISSKVVEFARLQLIKSVINLLDKSEGNYTVDFIYDSKYRPTDDAIRIAENFFVVINEGAKDGLFSDKRIPINNGLRFNSREAAVWFAEHFYSEIKYYLYQ